MAKGLAPIVEHYLKEWPGAGWAQAFHRLVELGAPALPSLAEGFEDARDPRLRAEVVAIAGFLRTDAALPLFASALADPSPDVWKAALDALVALATDGALGVLVAARSAPAPGDVEPAEYDAWVVEAIRQAQETLDQRRTP